MDTHRPGIFLSVFCVFSILEAFLCLLLLLFSVAFSPRTRRASAAVAKDATEPVAMARLP